LIGWKNAEDGKAVSLSLNQKSALLGGFLSLRSDSPLRYEGREEIIEVAKKAFAVFVCALGRSVVIGTHHSHSWQSPRQPGDQVVDV
jgi:hypothetical protein